MKERQTAGAKKAAGDREGVTLNPTPETLQGYLAHKKTPIPRGPP